MKKRNGFCGVGKHSSAAERTQLFRDHVGSLKRAAVQAELLKIEITIEEFIVKTHTISRFT